MSFASSPSATPEFIEQRKRALKRYLTLICRHPVLIKDDTVRYFFTASGAVGHVTVTCYCVVITRSCVGRWIKTKGEV